MSNSSEPSPELLRRLKEFQTQVRKLRRPVTTSVVPARGPLSGRQAEVLKRLRQLSAALSASLEQCLRDLNDFTRLSYMGPAGEVREVLRATIQQLAPDDEIRAQPWFVGHKQGDKINPTQSERTRLAVQKRGGNTDQARSTDELVEVLVAKISRETYAVGSKAFHAGTVQEDVQKLTGWVFMLLDEVLPG